MIHLDFSGQSVLVTGGSSGIGLGVARMFERAGANVAITGTREAATYGDDIAGLAFHQLNDGNDDEVRAFRAKWGEAPLDVLVNAIGTVRYRQAEFDIDVFREVLDVNLTGIFHLCTSFHAPIAQSAAAGRSGSMIIFGSLASFIATTNNPAYSASKGALAILTKTLADRWGRDGVRVNGVAPGFVETKLTKVSRDNPAIYEASVRKTPLGRWGTPEDQAGCALWLASPLASFVTGQMILVDGGISLSG
jgi:3-oxoacyl-[acyl-carrier protein] reductase